MQICKKSGRLRVDGHGYDVIRVMTIISASIGRKRKLGKSRKPRQSAEEITGGIKPLAEDGKKGLVFLGRWEPLFPVTCITNQP